MKALRMVQHTDSTIERNNAARHPSVLPFVDGLVLLHDELGDVAAFGDELFQTVGKLLSSLVPVRCHQLAVEIVFPVEHSLVDSLPGVAAELPNLKHLFRGRGLRRRQN